ncbi:MAG: DUF599 family protein [Hyphomicrobiales bacterium]
MTLLDVMAFILFICAWAGMSWLGGGAVWVSRRALPQAMGEHRKAWMRTVLTRDTRITDAAVMGGLQNGTAFFASTTIFAIGGCLGLLGSADRIVNLFSDLPVALSVDRANVELKIVGLTAIFVYSFFKFGWSYRLFNYCSIVVASIPVLERMEHDPAAAKRVADCAATLNIMAGKHFTAGLRAIFFALGYLGWMLGPLMFMLSTVIVLAVLIRRQFFSSARKALINGLDKLE